MVEEGEDEFSIVRKPAESSDESKAVNSEKKKPNPRSRIILVRNVAFQASQSELTALFKPIGGLIKVRMPQKPSGGHRGFAFVEFSTEDQANVSRFSGLTNMSTHRFISRRLFNILFVVILECFGDFWSGYSFYGSTIKY